MSKIAFVFSLTRFTNTLLFLKSLVFLLAYFALVLAYALLPRCDRDINIYGCALRFAMDMHLEIDR